MPYCSATHFLEFLSGSPAMSTGSDLSTFKLQIVPYIFICWDETVVYYSITVLTQNAILLALFVSRQLVLALDLQIREQSISGPDTGTCVSKQRNKTDVSVGDVRRQTVTYTSTHPSDMWSE